MTDATPTEPVPSARLVVPCYNEASRLRPEDVATLLGDPRVALVFVDDGSQDSVGDSQVEGSPELGLGLSGPLAVVATIAVASIAVAVVLPLRL